jgi:multidrug resistance efflux pump
VWLGVVLMLGSVAFVGLALHSHAQDPSAAAAGSAPPARERRAVAVAYVDVEGGVTNLYPVKPGRVVEVLVREGQEVEANAPLFRMDDTLERAQLAEAKLDLQAAEQRLAQARNLVEQHNKRVAAQKAAIEVARHDVTSARLQHQKAQRYFKQGLGGSAEDVKLASQLIEKARAGVQAEQAKLAALEALDPSAAVKLAELDVQSKREQRDKAQYALKMQTVTAPVKGVVLRSTVTVGEVLGPSPRQPALTFCPDVPRIVRAEVEQEFAGRVEVGQHAVIQDDATGTGDWRGRVVRKSDWFAPRRSIILEPLQFNDVRTLEAIILLEGNPRPRLRIGQRVRVNLEGP